MKKIQIGLMSLMVFVFSLLTVPGTHAGEWVPQKSPVDQNLLAVDFISPETGWAIGAGNTLIHTRDGGRTWQNSGQGLPKMPLDLKDVDFLDEKLGWIVGSTRLCMDAANCMAWGVILFTEDGGGRWDVVFRGDAINSSLTAACRVGALYGVSFLDEKFGWAVGADGVALQTINGGSSWRICRVGGFAIPELSVHLRDVQFISPKMGWAAGHVADMNRKETAPIIYKTQDSGKTWVVDYRENRDASINALDFVCPSADSLTAARPPGWAVGNKGLILKHENGKWVSQSFPWPISLPLPKFEDVNFASRTDGWIVGGYQVCPKCLSPMEQWKMVVFSTQDSGERWAPFFLDAWGCLLGTSFPSIAQGWAVGSKGQIFHYSDEAVGTLEGRVSWHFGTNPDIFPIPLDGALIEVMQEDGSVIAKTETGDDGHYGLTQIPEGVYAVRASKACYESEIVKGIEIYTGETTVQNFMLTKTNCPPEIMRTWADPYGVWAGHEVGLYVQVKDLDTVEDIKSVTVDLSEIGGGVIELDANIIETSDVEIYPPLDTAIYAGRARVSPLTSYGLKHLPVKVLDSMGGEDKGEITLFVMTSWVKIWDAWAVPNPVNPGEKISLHADVGIFVPREWPMEIQPEAVKAEWTEIDPWPYNQVAYVKANITELLGVDCEEGTDCIIWKEMIDEDGDGIYELTLKEVTGSYGKVLVPIKAEDSLGNLDRTGLWVKIQNPEDTDTDGIPDEEDNCTLVPNRNQRDTNDDGFGNICDPDLNNDDITDWLDLLEMIPCFRQMTGPGRGICDDADLNGNGRVGRTDVLIFIKYWGLPPGPAGALE